MFCEVRRKTLRYFFLCKTFPPPHVKRAFLRPSDKGEPPSGQESGGAGAMITATKMASAARGKAGQTHHVNRGARPKARGAVTTSARASGAMRQHNQPQPQPIQQKIFTGTDGDTHEKKTRASTRASLSSCPSFRSSDGGDRLLTQAHTYFHLSSSTLTDFCVPFFFLMLLLLA